MGGTVTIVTPEQVEITYELAGAGARFVAALVDHLLQLTIVVALVLGLVGLASLGSWAALDWQNPGIWLIAILLILVFAVIWGYFIYFETVWNGQTPGKRMAGIRVICDGGFPINFRTAAIRNLLRLLDWLPSAYGVGLISILASRDYKRVGDLAAGTIVVKETRGPADDRFTERLLNPVLAPPAQPPRYNVHALSRADYQAVRHFLDRRPDLPANVRFQLAARLADPLLKTLNVTPEYPWNPERFLEDVAREFEVHRRG